MPSTAPGELGRFVPAPPADGESKTIILDTSLQVFPLFDGSTPDAPPGFEVRGGVFHFTEINIPKGVFLDIRGNKPLVITATKNVQFAGKILLDGKRGTSENAFDSGVASIPGGKGGAGGGRGGESHPIFFWPPDQFAQASLVSPPRGGQGFGPGDVERTGGEGGESGIRDDPDKGKYYTDQQMLCSEFDGGNNGDQAAGGSGGSFLSKGKTGRQGNGNVRPDAQGNWILTERKGNEDWKVLYPGAPGISPFADADSNNDFIGVNGELKELIGGQGGGAGGSRSEAFYCGVWCKNDSDPDNDNVCKGGEWGNPPKFGDSVGDARGGSAGGGGGAVMIQALGAVTIQKSAQILARGRPGGGGETTGRSNWGGPAGGGSGGAIVIQSAEKILVKKGANLDVSSTGGGAGLVQLQVPVGSEAEVEDLASIDPTSSWVDSDNTMNPARFTAFSAGISTWFDLGRTIDRPPADTNPIFEFYGLDVDGYVRTDDDGNVLDPDLVDIRCDYLGQLDPLRPGEYKEGQEPRAHFIPKNATVQVLFQGARAIAEGSKEVDVDTITDWTPDPTELNSMQFLRYRITFDIAADKSRLRADAPRPAVQSMNVRTRF